MTSSKLSPAAQAVRDAYHGICDDYIEKMLNFSHNRGLAAALRAAADQVVPEEPLHGGDQRWMYERDARQMCRKKILAIADELEGVRYVYNPVQIAECGGPCSQGPQHCDCGALRVDDQAPTPPVAQARQLTDPQLIDAATEAGLCFPKCWSLDTTPEDIADDDAWVQDGFNRDEATGQHRQQLLNDARQLRANNLQRLRAFAALIQAAGNS